MAVSLEDLVPAANFYRHLEVTLDLGFIRDWVRELCAVRGRPGVDPVVILKLQLIMFFEGIRSGPSRRHGRAYGGSGSVALPTSTLRGYSSLPVRISSDFFATTGWGRRQGPCGSLVALPREQ
jgi:hypothetical protein